VAVASFANLMYLHGVDNDDVIDGIMGNGGDEGIDHCYIFCNGNLVRDKNHIINKESHIKIKLFQVKKEAGFSVDGFRKFKEGIEQIFNLDYPLDDLKKIGANFEYLEKADLIRNIFRTTRKKRAKFSCDFFYITISEEEKIPEKILKLQSDLEKELHQYNIFCSFENWGAQKLLDIIDKSDEQLEIQFNSQPLEIKERDVSTSGFAGFISGDKLISSLLDENNEFKSHLTEGNIRFFLGEDKNINKSIIETAQDEEKLENFWAMNNGLTIVGDTIEPLGSHEYIISNPQIVNGCQTIHCLYEVFIKDQKISDKLKIFVKLIKTSNQEVQADIITATNFQNPVKTASLKANDDIQCNIEKFLIKSDIFYERRDNFYKKQGYKGNKVISLVKMAQIMHSIVNLSSIEAANDTYKLFETETKYKLMFNTSTDYDIYKYATILFQKIWSLKNSDLRKNSYSNKEKNIISKSGFLLLNTMNSLIMSQAVFNSKQGEMIEKHNKKINISLPTRKNEFSKRKEWIFKKIEDDNFLEKIYGEAKVIIFSAAESYEKQTGKQQVSLFKYRKFDSEYLSSEVTNYLALTD